MLRQCARAGCRSRVSAPRADLFGSIRCGSPRLRAERKGRSKRSGQGKSGFPGLWHFHLFFLAPKDKIPAMTMILGILLAALLARGYPKRVLELSFLGPSRWNFGRSRWICALVFAALDSLALRHSVRICFQHFSHRWSIAPPCCHEICGCVSLMGRLFRPLCAPVFLAIPPTKLHSSLFHTCAFSTPRA